HGSQAGRLRWIMQQQLRDLWSRQPKDVGNVPRVTVSRLDTYRIDQDDLGQPAGIAHGDFNGYPAPHRHPHEDDVVQVQHIEQIEIQIDQIFERVEMLWDGRAGKARMRRRNDVEVLCQTRQERYKALRTVTSMQEEQRSPCALADDLQVNTLYGD